MSNNPISYDPTPGARYFAIAGALAFIGGIAMYFNAPPLKGPPQIAIATYEAIKYAAAMAQYAATAGTKAAAAAASWRTLFFALGAAVVVFGGGAFVLIGAYVTAKPKGEGESAFAKWRDIKRMKIHAGKLGPILGSVPGLFGRRILRPSATRHTLMVAPTRVGKTRQGISSILEFPGSVIVIDPKGEIHAITAAARAKRGPVHVINWTDPNTPDGYNFLARSNIPADPIEREKLAENVAAMLVPAQQIEQGGNGQHFNETARRNIAAFTLYEIYEAERTGVDGHPANISGRLIEALTDPTNEESFIADRLAEMVAHARQHNFPARVAEDIMMLANTHYEERSSHISTLLTKTQLLRSGAVRASLGKATFTFADFRQQPTTLYIRYPQSDGEAYGRLTAMFLDRLFDYCLDHPARGKDCPTLVFMDEFRDLPKLRSLIPTLTKGAGAGLALTILVQDLVQLKIKYQESYKEIRNNCEYIIVYTMPDKDTQAELSAIVGQESVNKKSKTTGRDIFKVTTSNTQGRQLIRPEQWGSIPEGKHVLLVRGHYIRPVLCDCVFWDKTPKLRNMVPPAARIPT